MPMHKFYYNDNNIPCDKITDTNYIEGVTKNKEWLLIFGLYT